MDQGHPIPQDITGFQFRLIGDMTVKQFAYLLAGAILAWLSFSFPGPFLIKLPFILLFAFSGVTLAFIPIHGRPADTMALLFLKALFRPNEYTKATKNPTKDMTATPQQVTPAQTIEEKKDQTIFFESHPQIRVSPTPEEPEQEETIEEKQEETLPMNQATEESSVNQVVSTISQELAEAKVEEQTAQTAAAAQEAHQKVLELQTQMQQVLSEKEDLEKQLIALRQQLDKKPKQVFAPTQATTADMQQTQRVKKIPQPMTSTVGAPFTPDVPNVITGVIKDSRGNVLPNILVEVKDKDDNPVRAFKTNSLGQFASATPLLNGTYTIMFEDPKKQQSFDTVEIVADGTILQPFEIISIDDREKLRQSLFN